MMDRLHGEATLDELLEDPIAHRLMERDGTDEAALRRLIRELAQRGVGMKMRRCASGRMGGC